MNCCCSLSGTAACSNCPNYKSEFYKPNYFSTGGCITFCNIHEPLPKVMKEIYDYDKDGKLVKAVIEYK